MAMSARPNPPMTHGKLAMETRPGVFSSTVAASTWAVGFVRAVALRWYSSSNWKEFIIRRSRRVNVPVVIKPFEVVPVVSRAGAVTRSVLSDGIRILTVNLFA